MGIIKQPDKVFPVADLLAGIRSRASGYDPDDLLEWWKRKQAKDREADESRDPG